MATAFQPDAFQNDAFQVDSTPPPPSGGSGSPVVHIGTEESLGVTSVPTIGGWQPWVMLLPLLWLGFQMEPPR